MTPESVKCQMHVVEYEVQYFPLNYFWTASRNTQIKYKYLCFIEMIGIVTHQDTTGTLVLPWLYIVRWKVKLWRSGWWMSMCRTKIHHFKLAFLLRSPPSFPNLMSGHRWWFVVATRGIGSHLASPLCQLPAGHNIYWVVDVRERTWACLNPAELDSSSLVPWSVDSFELGGRSLTGSSLFVTKPCMHCSQLSVGFTSVRS